MHERMRENDAENKAEIDDLNAYLHLYHQKSCEIGAWL